MVGRAYDPRFLFMWPTCRISIVGAKQAALVLITVKKTAQAAGKEFSQEEEQKIYSQIFEKYEIKGLPLCSSMRLWDDGIVFPKNSWLCS